MYVCLMYINVSFAIVDRVTHCEADERNVVMRCRYSRMYDVCQLYSSVS